MAWRGKAWRGVVWRGMAWQGMVGYGMESRQVSQIEGNFGDTYLVNGYIIIPASDIGGQALPIPM